MGCLTCMEKISDYIDNLLPSPERQQMENHFAQCPSCNSCYIDLLTICQASRRLPHHEPNPRIWDNILAEISSEHAFSLSHPNPGWLTRWFPLRELFTGWTWQPALAAVLLFVGLFAIWTYQSSTEPAPPTISEDAPGWSNPTAVTEIERANRLVIHKPLIEVSVVEQRIEELQNVIHYSESRWSPEVRDLYYRQLAAIDRCLANCRIQPSVSSDSPAGQAIYQATLRAKLEMLKQFSDL